MSDLTDRITEVLRIEQAKRYGQFSSEWTAHVAERIETELGLTEEWGIWYADTLDEPMPSNRRPAFWTSLDEEPPARVKELIAKWPGRAYGRRWVSAWFPSEEKPQ